MNITQLQTCLRHHTELAEAYRQGIEAAHTEATQARHDCLRHIHRMIKEPRTCAHPAARLSTETKARNKIIREVMESVAKRFHEARIENEDIPF